MKQTTNTKSAKLTVFELTYRNNVIKWLGGIGIPVTSVARIMNMNISTVSRIIDNK